MKIIFLLFGLIFLFPNFSKAQNENKSLLWKITSPNTKKESYLYGTMHISGRLAFHLGEEFFSAIEGADAVALESNPIIWLEEIFSSEFANDYLGKYGIQDQIYKGFYTDAFEITIPDNKNLTAAISNDHYLSNWLLYRENKSQRDFEEETFLDLFIYQTGMKNNKPVYSLEKFNQSRHFSKLGDLADPEKKELAPWYEKLLEEKNASTLIRDAYRNKDVLLIDSLHRQLNTANFYKYMLVERNEIMAFRIDSLIMQENLSLFIGIGAAHLAGEDGVIQMLRNKGYTVEAVSTTITDNALASKTKLDRLKKNLVYSIPFKSEMFSLAVPEKMYETPSNAFYQRQFFAPELTNGSFYYVKELSTYSYFSKTNHTQFYAKIDSLLFESIPGDIIEKKPIEKNGFKGMDILNKTSNGNFERFQLFFTPLNIFIFKMGGKDVFVENASDAFFNSVELTAMSGEWTKFSASKGDFSLETPAYFTVKGNGSVTSLYEHIELQAYDPKDENYYLLKRASLYDYTFIEEDNYELNRIADRFCDNVDIEEVSVEIQENTSIPTAMAYARTPDSSYLALKIVIRGPFYYILANVSKDYKKSNPFFESFTFGDFKYNFPFREKVDSTLLFTVESNYLYPTIYTDMFAKASNIRKENLAKKKVDDSYKEFDIDRNYYSENFERINVLFYKFHDYAFYEDVDSLWEEEIELVSKKNKLILRNKKTSQSNNMYYLEADFTDTNSSRVIKTKYILKQGAMYNLMTNTDTLNEESPFIKKFFDTFQPMDTLIGKSVLDDKATLFFNDVYSGDSTKQAHAFEAVKEYVFFEDEHAPQLMEMIENYPFSAKYIETKSQLIADLGKLENKDIIPFLTELYPVLEDTADYQIAILKALARQHTKKGNETFLKLLEYDIPLSSNQYALNGVFYPFYDSLELCDVIFPELLNYTFIEDYKKPVYYLLGRCISNENLKPSNYKKYYKQILREAKIELKGQISFEQAEQAKEPGKYYFNSYKNQGNYMLVKYTELLLPFYKKPEVQNYFEKLKNVEDFMVRTDIAILLFEKGIEIGENVWEELAEDLVNRKYLYEELEFINHLELFPKTYLSQEKMAATLLYSRNFNPETDSLAFIETREVTVKGKTGLVYFFKSKGVNDDDWELDFVGLQPLNENEVNLNKVVYQRGIKIEKLKEMSEIIDDQIENIELEGHYRAKKKAARGNYWW